MSFSKPPDWLFRRSDSTVRALAIVIPLLVILFSPVTFPTLAFLRYRERRRMRRIADSICCEICGFLLGRSAVEAAAEKARSRPKPPQDGRREFYPAQEPGAVCTHCGADYDFNLTTKEFVLRLRRIADGTICQNCNSMLGEAAIDSAAAKRRQETEQHTKPAANTISTAGSVDAICPHCRMEFNFDYVSKKFTPKPGA